MKLCRIKVIDHYASLEDSIVLKSENGYSEVLGVLSVVRDDFNPFFKESVIVPVNSTTDSYQIRPKVIKIKNGQLKYGSVKLSVEMIEKVLINTREQNEEEFYRILELID